MRRETVVDGVRIGVAGAASVVLSEHALSLAPGLAGSPLSRCLARLALAGCVAWVADRAGAERLATGAIAGAALVSSLDAGVALIARTPRRAEPPLVTDPAKAGDPWPPRPPYGP